MESYYSCFNGRTAVITGAASGMGLLLAREMAEAGANIVMCDINTEALTALAAEITAKGPGKAIGVTADVRKFQDAQAAADKAVECFGSLDYLLCIAGGNESRCCKSPEPFYEKPIEVIDWGLDVNLKGPVYFARACMPQMVRQKRGVILLTGSITGFEGDGYGAMYGTSKSGLFNFTKGLAKAGAPHGVRSVCVSPGPVLTREAMSFMGEHTLAGRAAEPIEIVNFMLYLCSDKASYITGTNHLIDGGRLCWVPN